MPIVDPTFLHIEADIRSVNIQGAQRIAREAVRAFMAAEAEAFKEYHSYKEYVARLLHAKERLFATRPTEPALRNALTLILNETVIKKHQSMIELRSHIHAKHKQVCEHDQHVTKSLPKIGSQKIKDGMHIFTHCHSSAVISVILDAHVSGKKITIHNTETRPLFQGRITARELAKHGVKVVHYPDSAARLAMKRCDLVLIGADAIDCDLKVYNKIGSEIICELAKIKKIPVYVCTDSWKFDPKTSTIVAEHIEERSPKEVWADAPKGVIVKNFAFEKIDAKLISGIICEFGIYTPALFLRETYKRYPQLFE